MEEETGINLFGWDDTNKEWIPVLVDTTGQLILVG